MTMRSEDVTKLSIGSAKVTISAGDSIFTLDAVRCLIEASDEVIQHSSVDGRAYNVCVGKTFHIEAFGDEFTSTGPFFEGVESIGVRKIRFASDCNKKRGKK